MQIPVSWWEDRHLHGTYDCLITGGGIIGMHIALQARKRFPHWNILIAERHPFALGASTRNAGFSCFGSVTEILDDLRTMTEHETWSLVEKRYQGLELLLQDFEPDAIGFRRCGSWEMFTDENLNEYGMAESNLPFINAMMKDISGEENVFQPAAAAASGISNVRKVLYNRLEGALDSGLLFRAMRKKCGENGISIAGGIRITHWEKRNGTYQLYTDHGFILRAARLVVATNAFAKELIPDLDIQPARGQVLVTAPVPEMAFSDAGFFDRGYIYFRKLEDRLLIGGARNEDFAGENTFDLSTSDTIITRLKAFVRMHLLPDSEPEYTHCWAGTMAMGSGNNRFPIVQRNEDNLYICARMGGMGVALGPMVARELVATME